MKKIVLFYALLLAATGALAQGPPPGMGNSGDGNGRSRSNAQTPGQSLNLDGNVPRGNQKVSGFVVSEALTSAVEFATVALFSKDGHRPVDGTAADARGHFSIGRVAPGNYVLEVSFIGYAPKSQDITVKKGEDADAGVIKLAASTQTLQEVTVTAESPLVEEKVDRMVYNAEKDISSRGGDGADILRKVPMLSVDLDGNVQLRGSSNIRVLINNKPSTIVAASVADALRMIPADLIKSVEVITSPSAKYDAEGAAGIVNIILKKSTLEGLTLNVDAGLGLRGSNLGLNGSYRTGRLGISLGGFGRAFYNGANVLLDQSVLQNGQTLLTRQNADARDNGLFGRYNLGIDYDLGKNQSLAAGVAFGTRNFIRSQDFTTRLYTDDVLTSTTYRDVKSRDLSSSVDANLDYIRTFRPGQEWSVSALYSESWLTNNFTAEVLSASRSLTGRQRNLNDNTNRELTLQTDYVTPISSNQVLEFGIKGIRRQGNSDFLYQTATANGGFSTDENAPKGYLNYSQNIAAAYVSYTYATQNKYTFKLGTRYERTSITAGDQLGSIHIPSYQNLVPGFNLSKSLSQKTTLKLSYNNRIQRPGLQQLNPNFNAANQQNINIGNPNLRPEISNNVELGLSTSLGRAYVNVSVFGRQTNNSITRIAVPSDTLAGAIITTWENIGREKTLGANLFGNLSITPRWTLNGGLDAFYNYLEGQQAGLTGRSEPVSNSGFVIAGRIQSQLSFGKGWGVQAFGGVRGNRVLLQGTQGGMGMYSLGIRRDFTNKKGSIGLAAENFFGGMQMRTTLNSPQLRSVSINQIYNQNIKLTFSYKIGKMQFKETKKSRVKNDDVMGGDSN